MCCIGQGDDIIQPHKRSFLIFDTCLLLNKICTLFPHLKKKVK